LALLTKESASALPLVTTIYEHFYREDRTETTWKQKLARYDLLWLLLAAYLILRFQLLEAIARPYRPQLGWEGTLFSGLALLGRYLGKLLWPAELSVYRIYRPSVSLLDPQVVGGAAALLLCAALFIALWKRRQVAGFGLLWLLVMLGPVLNARWMPLNAFAERYLYLPAVGFAWLAGLAWVRLHEKASESTGLWRRASVAVLAILAAVCVARIAIRNRDWSEDMVLCKRTLEVSPDAYPIRSNLGAIYLGRGDLKAAERELLQALSLAPKAPYSLANLGSLRTRQKRYLEAEEFFQRALRANPKYTAAHLGLADMYLETDEKEKAEWHFRAAVMLSPLNYDARNRLGKLYLDAGRIPEAEEQFRRSVESVPNAEGYDGLGDIHLRGGARTLAEQAFWRAASIDRFDSYAHFSLGALYAGSGRTAEAIQQYQLGLVTDPANPEALAALGRLGAPVPGADGKSPRRSTQKQ
jgi:tetratricopeptide (TPR) repeat protein